MTSLSVQEPKPSPVSTPSSTLYRTCSKLPLELFLDCLYDQAYEVLIIKGEASTDELKEAWSKIYLEYCSLNQDSQFNEVFDTQKKINLLIANIELVDGIIKHLWFSFDQRLVDILNEKQLRCTVTEDDKDDVLYNKLKTVVGRAKRWIIDLELLRHNFDQIQVEETEKTQRTYYDDICLVLGKEHGYHIKKSEVTVSEFVRMMIKLDEKYKRQLALN